MNLLALWLAFYTIVDLQTNLELDRHFVAFIEVFRFSYAGFDGHKVQPILG